MKNFKSILSAALLTLAISSAAFAGNISGAPGNISGAPGNISGAPGNISGVAGNISGLTKDIIVSVFGVVLGD